MREWERDRESHPWQHENVKKGVALDMESECSTVNQFAFAAFFFFFVEWIKYVPQLYNCCVFWLSSKHRAANNESCQPLWWRLAASHASKWNEMCPGFRQHYSQLCTLTFAWILDFHCFPIIKFCSISPSLWHWQSPSAYIEIKRRTHTRSVSAFRISVNLHICILRGTQIVLLELSKLVLVEWNLIQKPLIETFVMWP